MLKIASIMAMVAVCVISGFCGKYGGQKWQADWRDHLL